MFGYDDSRRFLLTLIVVAAQYCYVPLRFQLMAVKIACFKPLCHSAAFFLFSSSSGGGVGDREGEKVSLSGWWV